MPGGDRTGPLGAGQVTGRGAGLCTGYDVPGYLNPVGRGFGRGAGYMRGFGGGRGRGSRHQYWATGHPGWARSGWNYPIPEYYQTEVGVPNRKAELKSLKEQALYFGEALESINKRIDELQKEKKTSKDA